MSQVAKKLAPIQEALDIFATKPELKINARSKFSSSHGTILTIAVATFLLFTFVSLWKDALSNTSPSVFRADLANVTSDNNINILKRETTFQMGFGLMLAVTGQRFIDNSIYTVSASLDLPPKGNSSVWTSIPLEIGPCEESYFKNDNTGIYEGLWCFKEQQPNVTDLYVRTYYDATITIVFKKCDSETSQVPCSELSDLYIANSVWVSYYTDWLVNPMLHETPMTPHFHLMKVGIPQPLQRQISMSLSQIDFVSDNGWLFESLKSQSVVGMDKVEQDIFNFGQSNALIAVEINNNGNKVVYNRKYEKIQDVFAQIGGLAAVIIPIVRMFILPYTNFKMYEDVVNKLYEVRGSRKDHKISKAKKTNIWRRIVNRVSLSLKSRGRPSINLDQDKEDSDKKKRKRDFKNVITLAKVLEEIGELEQPERETYISIPSVKSSQNIANPLQVSCTKEDIEDRQTDHKKSRNGLTMEKEILISQLAAKPIEVCDSLEDESHVHDSTEDNFQRTNISYFRWLKSFCRADPQVELLNQGIEEIEGSLDIIKILDKILEIDRLKMTIFSKRHRILFDNMRKPYLHAHRKKKYKIKNSSESPSVCWAKCYKGDLNRLKNVYDGLKEKSDKTELDKKFLVFYEKEFSLRHRSPVE